MDILKLKNICFTLLNMLSITLFDQHHFFWRHNLLFSFVIKFSFFFCFQVYYEQLVLHPEQVMKKILNFLDIPWNESVLHHEQYINKQNGVALSKWVNNVIIIMIGLIIVNLLKRFLSTHSLIYFFFNPKS
jgi:hypothetical protein